MVASEVAQGSDGSYRDPVLGGEEGGGRLRIEQ
jgi:hypothetical protein